MVCRLLCEFNSRSALTISWLKKLTLVPFYLIGDQMGCFLLNCHVFLRVLHMWKPLRNFWRWQSLPGPIYLIGDPIWQEFLVKSNFHLVLSIWLGTTWFFGQPQLPPVPIYLIGDQMGCPNLARRVFLRVFHMCLSKPTPDITLAPVIFNAEDLCITYYIYLYLSSNSLSIATSFLSLISSIHSSLPFD